MHNTNEMHDLVMSHVNAMYQDAEQRRLAKMAKIEKQRGRYRRLALTVLRKLTPTIKRDARENDASPIDTQTMRALRQH
jgi:predicted transposase YdaD